MSILLLLFVKQTKKYMYNIMLKVIFFLLVIVIYAEVADISFLKCFF